MDTESQDRSSPTFKPGQIVAVFTDDAASGATLGYFGTVIELNRQSVVARPERWHDWKYVVYIPQLNANYLIRAGHLIPTNQVQSIDRIGPASELQFDREPNADNRVVSGRYRIGGRATWNRFQFVKTDDAFPSFQISMPVSLEADGASKLVYLVPEVEVLDRRYVIHGLKQICGEASWRDVTGLRRN